ncbi:hypothetical protein GQ42DRAFT_11899 [Ramicandelaber brevisporus]|nr:hypothetical protein GQ42DRAFT_11899 [Ramicandelaber brevisporus]
MSVTYEVTYFALVGRIEILRALAALGDLPLSIVDVQFHEWGALKPATPAGQLPVLRIKDAATGEVQAELTESAALERLLADRAGFNGATDVEAAKIAAFRAQYDKPFDALFGFIFAKPDDKEAAADKFKTSIAQVLAFHEALLAKNGGNGHYAGDKVNIADLTATLLYKLALVHGFADSVSEAVAPLFNKVVKATLAEPKLEAYYKALDARLSAPGPQF